MKRAALLTPPGVAGGLLLVGFGLLLSVSIPATGAAQAPSAPKGQVAQKSPTARKEAKEAKAAPGAVVKPRDPFRSLAVRAEEMAGGQALPPGKRGLVIPQLTVNGIVTTTTGNIAVVTMTGRNRAYFLRERDEVFNGYVGQITEDSVVFKEKAADAFGKEYEREVVKTLSGLGAKR